MIMMMVSVQSLHSRVEAAHKLYGGPIVPNWSIERHWRIDTLYPMPWLWGGDKGSDSNLSLLLLLLYMPFLLVSFSNSFGDEQRCSSGLLGWLLGLGLGRLLGLALFITGMSRKSGSIRLKSDDALLCFVRKEGTVDCHAFAKDFCI